MTVQLRCMTYNIHSGMGVDKRYDLGRIQRVVADAEPQIVALQELDCGVSRSGRDDQSQLLGQQLAVASVFCPTRPLEGGAFGLGLLSAFPVLHQQHYDLSHSPAREPRYCQRIDVSVAPGAVLHVFNCHLGLATRERMFQRDQMLSDAILLSADLKHPVVLMGDFNDRPLSVVHRKLGRFFVDAFRAVGKWWGPTFKLGPFPFRLDHIYCSRNIRVLDCWVRNDALARVASDHRPVIASIEATWP